MQRRPGTPTQRYRNTLKVMDSRSGCTRRTIARERNASAYARCLGRVTGGIGALRLHT